MQLAYAPTFIRMLKALPQELQIEALEKIELFQNRKHHNMLKVHKLKGRLAGRYSFSVNFRTRIVFQFANIRGERVAHLLAIGDHNVYLI